VSVIILDIVIINILIEDHTRMEIEKEVLKIVFGSERGEVTAR
jgi:hypothetical protein